MLMLWFVIEFSLGTLVSGGGIVRRSDFGVVCWSLCWMCRMNGQLVGVGVRSLLIPKECYKVWFEDYELLVDPQIIVFICRHESATQLWNSCTSRTTFWLNHSSMDSLHIPWLSCPFYVHLIGILSTRNNWSFFCLLVVVGKILLQSAGWGEELFFLKKRLRYFCCAKAKRRNLRFTFSIQLSYKGIRLLISMLSLTWCLEKTLSNLA